MLRFKRVGCTGEPVVSWSTQPPTRRRGGWTLQIAHMRWISSRTCERHLKQKVGDVSAQPLQPGGRWRSVPARGGENKTWGRLGFIATHLISDRRTHAGQKTVFNSVLRRCVSYPVVLFWRDTSPAVQARWPQPRRLSPRGSVASLPGVPAALQLLGARLERWWQWAHVSQAEERRQLWCLLWETLQNGVLLWFLPVSEEWLQSLCAPPAERGKDVGELSEHFVLYWRVQVLYTWPGTGMPVCPESGHTGPGPAFSPVSPQPESKNPEPSPVEWGQESHHLQLILRHLARLHGRPWLWHRPCHVG